MVHSLDLSYNRITDLAGLRGVRGAPLECLSLEWNALRSTAGLEDLPQLRALDLGYNFVCGISEAVRLSGEPFPAGIALPELFWGNCSAGIGCREFLDPWCR